ncbi:hypothetical protein EC142664_02391 [Escherichia coli O145:H28]|nr:hypothetical protein BvCmsSIP077_04250 [Escherichia coli]GEF47100.1 hypothetical protein EC142664_02391 [Escherichia coli O145:H28]
MRLQCFTVVKHAIVQRQVEVIAVAHIEVQADIFTRSFRAIEANGHKVEQHFDRHSANGVRGTGGAVAELMHPFAQLFRAGQVETAPCGGLGLIAQLFKVIRLQILRDLVTRVGGNHLFQQFCRPAVITLLVRFLRQVDDTGRTAQRFHVTFAHLYLTIRMQVSRVTVVIAKIEVIHRAGVVADRTVIAAAGPVIGKRRRQLNHVADFIHGVALVRQVQGLVVNILDGIAIFTNIIIDMLIAPDRPGVRHKQHFRVVTPHIQRFVQVLGPLAGIAGFRAAQSVEVVQSMRGVLGGTQGFQGRNIEVHFGWRFATWGHQEVKLQAVDNHLLASSDDSFSRCNNARVARCQRHAKAITHVALRVVRQ